MHKQLAKILSDNKSGSIELLVQLCAYISQKMNTVEEFEEMITHCKMDLSSFEVINSFITRVKDDFHKYGLESAKKFSFKYCDKLTDINNELFDHCFDSIKNIKSLLTISNSSTLKEIITKLHKHNPSIKVVALESRPNNEGRLFTHQLLKNRIDVTLAVDMAACKFMKDVEAVFCGVDKILSNFSIVNKIGSLQLALLCKEYSKPFYAFGYENKISSENNYFSEEYNPKEIWRYHHQNLAIKNYYFEVVPRHLITSIFTEKRIIKTKEL